MRLSCVPLPVLLLTAALMPAFAWGATPLTALNGQWSGGGTDRDGPFGTLQPTRCRATLKADATHLTSTTECDGAAGLHKRFHLAVTFQGERFTGSVEQVSSVPGAASTRYAGSVSGSREGDVANFTANFGALIPSAHVTLAVTSANSYSMRVSLLGSTLTDVTLRRSPH